MMHCYKTVLWLISLLLFSVHSFLAFTCFLLLLPSATVYSRSSRVSITAMLMGSSTEIWRFVGSSQLWLVSCSVLTLSRAHGDIQWECVCSLPSPSHHVCFLHVRKTNARGTTLRVVYLFVCIYICPTISQWANENSLYCNCNLIECPLQSRCECVYVCDCALQLYAVGKKC